MRSGFGEGQLSSLTRYVHAAICRVKREAHNYEYDEG